MFNGNEIGKSDSQNSPPPYRITTEGACPCAGACIEKPFARWEPLRDIGRQAIVRWTAMKLACHGPPPALPSWDDLLGRGDINPVKKLVVGPGGAGRRAAIGPPDIAVITPWPAKRPLKAPAPRPDACRIYPATLCPASLSPLSRTRLDRRGRVIRGLWARDPRRNARARASHAARPKEDLVPALKTHCADSPGAGRLTVPRR